MRPTTFTGRAWVLLDGDALFDDIDTDMIYHNAHLAITDVAMMGQYALGNLKGYEEFARRAEPGDIVFAGRNFGAGSSRQQAVDCFRALGVSCIVARSFGAIYKRNAINAGFPIFTSGNLAAGSVAPMREVEVDAQAHEVRQEGRVVARLDPVSRVQMDIYQAGDLFAYAKGL